MSCQSLNDEFWGARASEQAQAILAFAKLWFFLYCQTTFDKSKNTKHIQKIGCVSQSSYLLLNSQFSTFLCGFCTID
jgi:hypothetical protein